MFIKLSLLFEPLPTHVAHERLLPAVGPQMVKHIAFLIEALATAREAAIK